VTHQQSLVPFFFPSIPFLFLKIIFFFNLKKIKNLNFFKLNFFKNLKIRLLAVLCQRKKNKQERLVNNRKSK